MSYLTHLESLETKFSRLDELPEALYCAIVTHTHGQLNERIKGILQWRDAFLLGQLPEERQLSWPEPAIGRMILKRVEVLEIVQYCENQPELTDSILLDVCEAISSAEQWQEIDPGFDDAMARQQKQLDKDSPFEEPGQNLNESEQDSSVQNPKTISADRQEFADVEDTVLAPAPETVIESMDVPANVDFIHPYSDGLEQRWQELSQQWQQLASVFSELGGFLGRGWDLTQGLLASEGWRDIVRYRQLVTQLPWLEQVIAAMGRMREISSDEPESITEQIFEPVKRLVDEETEVRSLWSVYETSGIRRSDDISRLLPSELTQLGHPQLNLLWHAKRAEHALLTYQVDGVMSEHEPVEQEILQEVQKSKPETEQGYGPIIVCLDCSASMQGEAENIAKALVLEALSIAWQENRSCYVYSFSGPEQVLHHQLDLARGGLKELLGFLTQTFHGGTDVINPLMQALSQQKQESWKKSDILLVSDGRFPITQEQQQQIAEARKQCNSRIHGVLVGQWQGTAIQSVCDNFHRVPLSSNL